MNDQKEINYFFEFEKRKHKEFFLPYYQQKGTIIVFDYIVKGIKHSWDVRAKFPDGKEYTIDEKARTKEWGDCLIEIIQDLRTGSIGWLWGEKDYILYGSWQDENDIKPFSLYSIDSKALLDFTITNWKKLKDNFSEKGFGFTFNKLIPWEDLIFCKIAKKIDL